MPHEQSSQILDIDIAARAIASARSVPVTADLFRPANLFRRNIFASVFVPVFRNLSGFVLGESC